jgi:hypothetical protein
MTPPVEPKVAISWQQPGGCGDAEIYLKRPG